MQVKKEIWQNELLTVKEAAAYLRVGHVTVWRWCKEGIIPAFRIGRNWRIRRRDLLQLGKRKDTNGAQTLLQQSQGQPERTQNPSQQSQNQSDGT